MKDNEKNEVVVLFEWYHVLIGVDKVVEGDEANDPDEMGV